MTLALTHPAVGTDHFLEIDGLLLHLWRMGDLDLPAVVVLHGIMGHVREWDTLSSLLSTRYHVVAVDQRGHGQSAWSTDYTASRMADDLIGVVEELGLATPHVVAHSMGGMAALLAAARRPELFGHLALIDIGPDSLTPALALTLSGWIEHLGRARYPNPQAAIDEWMQDPLTRADSIRNYVVHNLVADGPGRYRWRFDAERLRHFPMEGVEARQLWEAVDAVRSPTLVVRGRHSEVLTEHGAREMLARLARAAHVVIPDGGHDLGVQQPERVAQAVMEFLSDRNPVPIIAHSFSTN